MAIWLFQGVQKLSESYVEVRGVLKNIFAFCDLLSIMKTFLPPINLLILVYWNAIFTNGKVLLLLNYFNPSLSQKKLYDGQFSNKLTLTYTP